MLLVTLTALNGGTREAEHVYANNPLGRTSVLCSKGGGVRGFAKALLLKMLKFSALRSSYGMNILTAKFTSFCWHST